MSKRKLKNLSIIFEDSRFGGPHYQSINNFFFLKKKFNVSFIISNIESNDFRKKLKINKIPFEQFKIYFLSVKIKYLIKYLFNFFQDIKKIKNYIYKKKINYVYIAGGSNNFKTVLACINTKVKIIWHIHDSHSNFFLILIFKYLSKHCYKIIFSSANSKNYYAKQKSILKKSIILQSSVKNIKNKKIKKNKIFFTIGSIGNFNNIKNQILLINIANQFKNCNKIKFVIIGNVWKSQRKYFDDCKKLIANYNLKNIEILQKCKNVLIELKKFDIFLLCSLSESSPIAAWEAMSLKKPIICSNVGDLKTFYKQKKFGVLINDYNKNNYVTAIKRLIRDKKLREAYSKNSYNLFQQNFTNTIYKKKLLEFL